MSQKGNALIIGILIGLLTAGGLFGAYYLGTSKNNTSSQMELINNPKVNSQPQINPSPTQGFSQTGITSNSDETVGWRTFTESSIGLTFKYPSNWRVAKSPGLPLYITGTPLPENESGFTPLQISLDSARDDQGKYLHFDTIQQAKKYYLKDFGSDVSIIDNLLIGNKPAVSIEGTVSWEGPGYGEFLQWTLIQLDNKVVVVSLGKKDIQNTFNQILSTFKFL